MTQKTMRRINAAMAEETVWERPQGEDRKGKGTQRENALGEARPKQPTEFSDALTWAAWLYFVDELTQSEVAKRIGVSRVTVIKMLNEAKEKGLVSVHISPAIASQTITSRKLAAAFGLNSVTIIPDNDDIPLVGRLGQAGAFAVTESLQENDVIGVAWGKTVLALAKAVNLQKPVPNLTVAQVSASPNGLSADFSPELCSSLLANNLGARSVNLLAPAFVSSPELRSMLLNEPSIRNQLDVIRSANKVIFGVGEITPGSTLRNSDLHPEQTVERLIKKGAVGNILGKFVDRQGNEMMVPTHDRAIGMSLEELLVIPNRLCVAGGAGKDEAIYATLSGGYATDLITNLSTAEALLKAKTAGS